jgi:hypothetical protein
MPLASRLLVLQLRISCRFFASDLPQPASARDAKATAATSLLRGAALEAFDGEAESKHRGVDVALQLVVQRARLGDVGQELERVADVLLGRLLAVALQLDAAFGGRAAIPAGPPLDGHERDAATPFGAAALRG